MLAQSCAPRIRPGSGMGARKRETNTMNITQKNIAAAGALAAVLAGGIFIGHATADQPHMQNALNALLSARSELATAVPDKGGHRLAAIAATDRAIAETRAGMRFAR
jgi:hypothetical protein